MSHCDCLHYSQADPECDSIFHTQGLSKLQDCEQEGFPSPLL